MVNILRVPTPGCDQASIRSLAHRAHFHTPVRRRSRSPSAIWSGGIRSGQRAWRIGSLLLLLMLVAIAKVFILDASGLEGLLRIVSFLALGFSLIGIGWLYSRYLKPDTT